MTTLGSLLVQNHVVGVVEIEKALQRQVIMGGDLATNLLELSLVKEDTLAKYTAKAFGLPVLEKALLEQPDPRVVKMMPWDAAEKHRIVPVAMDGNTMIVATAEPPSSHSLEEIGFLLGVTFDPRFVLEFRLAIALKRCFGIAIPRRMAKLQKKLAPDTMEEVVPIAPRPSEKGIVSGIAPAEETRQEADDADDSATLQADADYQTTVEEAVDEPTASEVAEEVSPLSDPETAPAETASPPPDAEPEAQPEADAETPVSETEGEMTIAAPPDAALVEASRESDHKALSPEKKKKSLPPEPLNLEKIAHELLQAAHRDEILNVLMKNASSVFDFAMLFVIHGKDAEAHLKTDEAGNVEKVESPVLEVDSGGMLEIAYNTRSFYLGQTGKNDTDRLLLAEMNRARPRNCAIVPVTLRNRVIMLLYGDRGKKGVKAEQMSDLSQLARLVSEAFERLLLEKKYGQYRAQVSKLPSRPAHPAFSRVPSGRLSDMPASAGFYRIAGDDTSGKFRPSVGTIPTGQGGMGSYIPNDSDPPITEKQMAQMASLVKSLAPGRAAFGGAAGDPGKKQPVQLALNEDVGGVHAERIISVSSGARPRSVEVNMQEEIDRLVTRVITSKKYDRVAVEVLVGIGNDAVRKLVEHFPGPLTFDRYQESGNLPRITRHGHLLKAITKFGKMAVPHILPLLESRDTDVRFYATFMFSLLKFPEALDALTDRLFDPDRHIRAIAIDVIRGFVAHPEYRWAVQRIASVLESTDRDLEPKYLAIQALGDLGEPIALEPLVKLLGSADEKMVKMVHRALIKIALFDHGFTEKRWLDWYKKNRSRCRLEWAIDGLTNEEADIRELAYRALKARIEDVLEASPFPENLRDFKALQERLRKWWKDEGKEIHQLTEGI